MYSENGWGDKDETLLQENIMALATIDKRMRTDLKKDFGTEKDPNPEKNTQFHNFGHFESVAVETVDLARKALLTEGTDFEELPYDQVIKFYSIGLVALEHDSVLVFPNSIDLRAKQVPERGLSEFQSAERVIGIFEQNGLLRNGEGDSSKLSKADIYGILGATVADIGFETYSKDPVRVKLKINQPILFLELEMLLENPQLEQFEKNPYVQAYLAALPDGLNTLKEMSDEAILTAVCISNGDLRNAAGKMDSSKYLETGAALLREERIGIVEWTRKFDENFADATYSDLEFIIEEIFGWYSVQGDHVKYQREVNDQIIAKLGSIENNPHLELDTLEKVRKLRTAIAPDTRYPNFEKTAEVAETFYQELLEEFGAFALYISKRANTGSTKIPSKFGSKHIEEMAARGPQYYSWDNLFGNPEAKEAKEAEKKELNKLLTKTGFKTN